MTRKLTDLNESLTREIEERKKSEEQLKETSDRLQLAMQAGSIGVWEWNIASGVSIWDKQMFRLFAGCEADNLPDTYDRWRSRLHPADLEQAEEKLRLALDGVKNYDTEFRVVWPDGTSHSIYGLAVVQRDAAGRVLRMLGTNWDVTAQRQTADELKAKK